MAANFVYYIGRKYGDLTVIEYAFIRCGHHYWVCECKCKNRKIVAGTTLNKGKVTSCGCVRGQEQMFKPHGMSKTAEYRAWHQMIQRCVNPNIEHYPIYGGRGIEVCERWRKSFIAFFEDMGVRPKGYSIDRIDTNGNYEPSNCRWADVTTQQSNKRNNTLITMPNGDVVTLTQAAKLSGIGFYCLQRRNIRHKGNTEKLFAPYKPMPRKIKDLC